VYPNGYKAQVVATSREAAVRYKQHFDAALAAAVAKLEASNPIGLDVETLKAIETDVIISTGHNDLPHIKAYGGSRRHETSIKRFTLGFGATDEGVDGKLGILIVNNMLLTGFDAPVEQVMYLDKVVVAHNLLQTIARVNRVGGADKDKGFIVDYVGVGHHLKRALDNYDEREQKEVTGCLSFPERELRELQAAHVEIIALLKKHGLNDLTDHDACFDVFYDEDIRFAFMLAFKKFTRALNTLFPAKESLAYMRDFQALNEVNILAGKHFRDARLSMKGIPPKLRTIADAHLVSKGIDVKIAPISILDEDFEKDVKEHKRIKTKAAEVEHAIRHHLEVELDDDTDLQASFSEALAAIFVEFKDNWQKIYDELEKLRQRIKDAGKEPTYGLHRKKQMPFFRMFHTKLGGLMEQHPDFAGKPDERIAALVDLTQQIYNAVERELKLTGFWESVPARNKLKAELQQVLLSAQFANVPSLVRKREAIISRVMELAEAKNDTILHAA